MKKWIALFLTACMLIGVLACDKTPEPVVPDDASAEPTDAPNVDKPTDMPETTEEPIPETFFFTDSTGRTVEIPTVIDRIAVSGPLAQIVLFALCPEKLVGVATAWEKSAEKYIGRGYFTLPELGQLYGGKGELNLETLLSSGAQVVIDVGEPKETIKEDLDALTEQTGIPFVHISATLATMDRAYRMLGKLLRMPDEAETLAAYCEETYAKVARIAESVEKVKLLYITGDQGLNVIAKGSYHAEVIDFLSDNLAVVQDPSSKGTGNRTDMEQILLWNPDVILFAPDSFYAQVGSETSWTRLTAVQKGTYYEVPTGPYNWMGFPPSVQRLLGMLWMAKLLYPDAAEYDLYEETAVYYDLFYHYRLTKSDYEELVQNSIGVQQALQPAA